MQYKNWGLLTIKSVSGIYKIGDSLDSIPCISVFLHKIGNNSLVGFELLVDRDRDSWSTKYSKATASSLFED